MSETKPDLHVGAVVSAAHTPGPWNVGFCAYDVLAGDMKICDIRGWGHLTGKGALGLPYEQAEAIQNANALLIAAAPDLLAAHLAWEAAEEARNDCTDPDDGCDNEGPWEACPLCSERFGQAIDLRHAAIAKATGSPGASIAPPPAIPTPSARPSRPVGRQQDTDHAQ